MSRRRPAAALAAAILALSACGRLPATRYYVLEIAPGDALPPAAGQGLVVGVRPFHVDPPYDQDRIVFRLADGAPDVGFYTYHRWAVPLGRMLPVAVAAALRGVPGLASVEPAVPGEEYAAVLTGRLLALEEVGLPSGQAIRVRLSLSLSTAAGDRIWAAEIAGERHVQADEVRDVVVAARAALADALAGARPGLEHALAARVGRR